MRDQFLSSLSLAVDYLRNPANKRFLSNLTWLFTDKLVRLVVGVIVGAWVARYLGPQEYGLLSYALIFCSFFATVSTLGLDGIIIRELSTSSSKSNEILGTSFYLRLFSGLVLVCVSIFIILMVESNATLIAITAILALGIIFQSADVIDLWFQSKSQSKKTILPKGTSYLIVAALKILIIFKGFTLIYFAVISLLEIILSSALILLSYKKSAKKINWIFNKNIALSLLRESWPYVLSSISILVYMRIDQVMIRAQAGDLELGIYSAAVQLSSVFNSIPMILMVAVGPIIAKLSANNVQASKKLLSTLFVFIWWSMLPLGILFFVFSESIINIVYGAAYEGAAKVLGVHIFTNIPIGLGVVQSLWIINNRKSSLALYKTIIGAVINIGLNFYLIPLYGALGAAVATLVAQSFSAVLCNIVLAPEIFKLQLLSIFFIKSKA